jgi:insulysin
VVAQAEGLNDIPDLFLPGPNEFIPNNLDVDKREVAEVPDVINCPFIY